MRVVVALDGTSGAVRRQAQALGAFLRDGLRSDVPGQTVLFYADARDARSLVELAPTRDVRLVSTTARRPDRVVETLTALARDEEIGLFLFAGGPAGTELAARLARRAGGAVLTDALTLEVAPGCLLGRKHVYSNHMVGRFELRAPPWCVSIDASWTDTDRGAGPERRGAGPEHRVLSDTAAADMADAAAAQFEDVELGEPSSAGDIAESRFLVVAGSGAGSRDGVQRIAAAARAMGAAFGVSRPVAMNAWAPRDRLIGVSGARTAPEVCIVAGASGAPALHWGIEKATFIAAVNTDDGAPIVKNADAALLDDAVAVVEELARLFAAERRGAGETS